MKQTAGRELLLQPFDQNIRALALLGTERLPLITDVNSDLENRNPVVNVKIMRDRAAMLGVTPLAIGCWLAITPRCMAS